MIDHLENLPPATITKTANGHTEVTFVLGLGRDRGGANMTGDGIGFFTSCRRMTDEVE
jgi:hypothetical protein